jgi:hypothetical protein
MSFGNSSLCNFHGIEQDGSCQCDPAWVFQYCSEPWSSYSIAYNTYKFSILAIYAAFLVFFIWKLQFLVNFERRKMKCLIPNTQVTLLLLIAFVCILHVVIFIDPISAEHIYSLTTIFILYSFAGTAFFTACGLTIRIFLQIRSKIHPPSRKILKILDTITSIYIILNASTPIYTMISLNTSQLIYNLVSSFYTLFLLIGSSVYSIKLLQEAGDLRSPPKAGDLRSPPTRGQAVQEGTANSTDYRSQTKQLILIIRITQGIGGLGILLVIFDTVFSPNYVVPNYYIPVRFLFRFFEYSSLCSIFYLMGRKPEMSHHHFEPNSPRTGIRRSRKITPAPLGGGAMSPRSPRESGLGFIPLSSRESTNPENFTIMATVPPTAYSTPALLSPSLSPADSAMKSLSPLGSPVSIHSQERQGRITIIKLDNLMQP